MDEPMRTVTAGGLHHAEVRAFLVKYFGTDKTRALKILCTPSQRKTALA
jgi:hypothetical protein